MRINNTYQANNIREKELLAVVDILEWAIWVLVKEISIQTYLSVK